LAKTVTLVGARDAKVSELLKQLGVPVNAITVDDLSAWSARVSTPSAPIIVDTRGRAQLPPALVAFKRRHPGAAVIIIASALEPALMLEAMRAGVTECVAEPLSPDEITAALQRVVSQHQGEAQAGKVFAFLGAKGGVGTTTAAVNVATELAKLAPSGVLLIDLHLVHGDAAVFLGVEPRFSVVDALENIHRLDDAFLRSLVIRTRSGVDLLASSDRMLTMPIDAARIRALVDVASHQYRYTVLDVQRSEASALDALEAADRIVVVANQELATVRGAGRITDPLQRRYGRDRIAVVVSRYDLRGEIGQTDIERAVGLPVHHVLPSNYRLALQALNNGQPLVIGNHSDLAGSFRALASDLAGIRSQESQRSGGLFGSFRRRS
jgi:pilus assembly protein CpaE